MNLRMMIGVTLETGRVLGVSFLAACPALPRANQGEIAARRIHTASDYSLEGCNPRR